MSYSCPTQGQIFNRICVNGTHTATNCGQFANCVNVLSDNTISSIKGCCRQGIYYANAAQIIVYIIIIPIIGISSLGALGAGVIKRPFIESVLNFNATYAGNMTMTIQFAAQLINIIIVLFQTHPEAEERPIINYEIAIIYCLAIPLSFSLGLEFANFLPLGPLLWIQILFLLTISPILFQYGTNQLTLEKSKLNDNELLLKSALVPVEKAEFSQEDEKMAKRYRLLYIEAANKLPLSALLITLGNLLINIIIIQTRSTPGQTSPYFDFTNDNNDDKKECTVWNFYMLLLLFSVNIIITLLVYFFKRKEEFMKDTVNFCKYERYYTPGTRFWKIYAAGFASGFVAGFFGMAAGLVMMITMVSFGLIAAVAGGTANFCYFIICIQQWVMVLVNNHEDDLFTFGDFCLLFAIGIVSVLTFTNLGYYYMKKYNVGHILFYIDFAIVLLNILGNLAWGLETGYREDGYKSLMASPNLCGKYAADV